MDNTITAPYRALLLAQRQSLLAQLAILRGGPVSRAEASAAHFGQSEDSRAQVTTERELELALDDRENAELRAVDAALARIDEGRYGQCLACGTDIPATRLQAAPEALRCVACQTQFEAAHPGL